MSDYWAIAEHQSKPRHNLWTITSDENDEMLSKVPEVTLGFWVIKILATTLGETGGDSVTMTWPLSLSARWAL